MPSARTLLHTLDQTNQFCRWVQFPRASPHFHWGALSYPLSPTTSSSGLRRERLELLERLCRGLPGFSEGPGASRGAAAQ